MPFTMQASSVGGSCFCKMSYFSFFRGSESIINCHCKACRGVSGATFSTWVSVNRTRVLHLPTDHLNAIRFKESLVRYSCAMCSSHIYTIDQKHPETIGFPLGAITSGLDDAAVQAHYCVDEKAPWHTISDNIPQVTSCADFDPLPFATSSSN